MWGKERDGTCGMHERKRQREKRNMSGFGGETRKKETKDLGLDRMVIIKLMLDGWLG